MFNRFYYRGFQPNGELEAATEALLEALKKDGPSDGTFLGSVEVHPAEVGESYLARLDLYSMHGPFLADAVSHDPRQAIASVVEKIRGQLAYWKSRQAPRGQSPLRDPYTMPYDA